MDIDRTEIGSQYSRATEIFRRISVLCFIAFLIIALWSIWMCILLVISIENSSTDSDLILSALPMLSIYTLYGINFSLIPLLLGRMLRDISIEGRPFTEKNAGRLFKLAVIMVLYAILERISLELQSQFMLYIGNNEIQVGNFIYDFASHSGTSVNIFPLIIAGVFFALSYVFKYGVSLQQQSDETL